VTQRFYIDGVYYVFGSHVSGRTALWRDGSFVGWLERGSERHRPTFIFSTEDAPDSPIVLRATGTRAAVLGLIREGRIV
jgi:hypothetical protein